ncbi:glycosyltransferase [Peribacillus butanolivorans]|uniref:tetratricopeptide repeat-containing glycosyltransferase n=1 Tax=Peribacillus butanolivorans TaxID=421767 RepID=UPI003D289296
MKKLKIAVYAICKNEEQFIDKWMDSMQEADLVVVADTGSTDQTVEKLKSRGAHVYNIKVDPWRFDVARNISMNFVPEDVDVCVVTDLDEIFEPGWRDKIEKAWTEETTRLKYMFTWTFNPDGTRGSTFWKGKIHRRHGFRWVHPVHEVLYYYGSDLEKTVWDNTIQLNHFPDNTKSRGQYLPLLELAVKEDPDYVVNVFYLGREYMYYEMFDKCIETLNNYLLMPAASWIDQRSASMRYIARAYKQKGIHEEAKKWLYKAIAEAPHLREPYVEMAKFAHLDKDWPRVYHMVEEALKIKSKKASYMNEAFAWNHTIYDLGALSCYNLGLIQKSYEFAKIATELAPGDERLENNLNIIEKIWISKKDQ